MSVLIIIAGLLLALIGWSVHYDDREFERLADLDAADPDFDSALYDDEFDDYMEGRYGSYAPLAAFLAGLFYTVRGTVIGIAGIWLVIAEVF